MSRGPSTMDWAAPIASSPVDFMKKLVLPWRWDRNIRSSNSRVKSMARNPWRSLSGAIFGDPGADGPALIVQNPHQSVSHIAKRRRRRLRVGARHGARRRNNEMAEIRRIAGARGGSGNMKIERTHGRAHAFGV